jgi:hypothetical protein
MGSEPMQFEDVVTEEWFNGYRDLAVVSHISIPLVQSVKDAWPGDSPTPELRGFTQGHPGCYRQAKDQ